MDEPVGEPQPEPTEPPAAPEPAERKPGGRAGMISALLCLAAAALTTIGLFQNLVVAENVYGSQRETYLITLWDARFVTDRAPATVTMDPTPPPQNGVAMLFAVALLLTAALLGTRNPVRRFGRPSGLATVGAAMFLTGAVAVVVTQAFWWTEVLGPPSIGPQPELDVAVTVGPGPAFWTLVVGVALAIVAATLAWRQPRAEPERVEPDTPRMGIPVVVRRLPDEY